MRDVLPAAFWVWFSIKEHSLLQDFSCRRAWRSCLGGWRQDLGPGGRGSVVTTSEAASTLLGPTGTRVYLEPFSGVAAMREFFFYLFARLR